MRQPSPRALLAVGLLATAACGGGSGSDDASTPTDAGTDAQVDAGTDAQADAGTDAQADAGPGSIAQEDYAAALAAAYCEVAAPCCAPQGAVRDDCVAFHRDRAQEILDGLSDAQRYDPEQAAACIAALRATPAACPEPFDWATDYRAVCADVVRGTTEPGEPCEAPHECEPPEGAIGDLETGFAGCGEYGGESTRRCRRFNPTTEVGTECEMGFGGDAPEVFVCAGDLTCEDGQCTDPPSPMLPDIGESCEPADGCAEGRCDETTMECVAFGEVGDDCEPGTCAPELRCIEDVGSCTFYPPAPTIGFAALAHRESCTYE